MSLLPVLFRDLWDDTYNSTHAVDHYFGNSLRPRTLWNKQFLRPWHEPFDDLLKGDGSSVKIDKDKFEVILDVQQFNPKEIDVKVTEDGYLVVEGKHEEKQDEHGFVARHFCRRYKLPEGVNPDQVQPALSSDGLLTLTAPMQALSAP